MSRSAHFSRLKTAKTLRSKNKSSLQPSKTLELDIVRLDSQGNGVATLPLTGTNKTAEIKVPYALVDERCLVNYAEGAEAAELIQLVHPSEQRQEPLCEHFAECGGCQLQHMAYQQQLHFKRDRMWQGLEALLKPKSSAKKSKPKLGQKLGQRPQSKSANAPVLKSAVQKPEDISVLASEPFGYRRRARLGISKAGQLGFRRANSNDTLSLHNCLNLSVNLQQVMQCLNRFFVQFKDLSWSSYIGHVELLDVAPSPLVLLRVVKSIPADVFSQLRAEIEQRDWRLAVQKEKSGDYIAQLGDLASHYSLHGLDIAFEPGKFIQINDSLNQAMIKQAFDWLTLKGDESLLDLFCGTGNISLALAQQASQVFGVELSPEMVSLAKRNAENLGFENVEFMAANLDDGQSVLSAYEKMSQLQPDIVVLDPPRAGAAGFIPTLLELSPQRILYISCHQGSFLRDLYKLAGASYRLEKLSVMDMFPNTEHVECMALLSR